MTKQQELVKELVDKYLSIEKDLVRELDELPRCGEECKCRNKLFITIPTPGFMDDSMDKVCIHCGGTVAEDK